MSSFRATAIIFMTQKVAHVQFVVKCLIGIAVFASPCAYDPEPRQPSPIAAMAAIQQTGSTDRAIARYEKPDISVRCSHGHANTEQDCDG
jgi:hypothetical protein